MEQWFRMTAVTVLLWAGAAQSPATSAEGPGAVQANAITIPSQDIQVATQVRGVIRRVLAKEGDKVTAGQALIELDSELQKAALAVSEFRAKSMAKITAAEANLRVKRADYERATTLYKKGVASDADIEKAELESKEAEIVLTVAKEQQEEYRLQAVRDRAELDRMTVRSPVTGVLFRELAHVGEATLEEKPLFRLVVLDVLHVVAYVSPEAAARLRVDQPAQLELAGAPGPRHACKIIMVDPVIEAGSTTCRVKLALPNSEHKTQAGARGTVYFHPAAP